MKNVTLKPLDKKVIQPWEVEDPEYGRKWVPDAKRFFAQYPIGKQFGIGGVLQAATDLLPDWFKDKDGAPVTLTTSEVVGRLNLGGGNKYFGEPRLQVFYHSRSRSHLVIDGMELIDQINVAERMAKTGRRAQERLEYALQIATSQMKLELSSEQQQEVLSGYANEVQGVELATKWADRQTRSLKQAVSAVLGNGNDPDESSKVLARNKR